MSTRFTSADVNKKKEFHSSIYDLHNDSTVIHIPHIWLDIFPTKFFTVHSSLCCTLKENPTTTVFISLDLCVCLHMILFVSLTFPSIFVFMIFRTVWPVVFWYFYRIIKINTIAYRKKYRRETKRRRAQKQKKKKYSLCRAVCTSLVRFFYFYRHERVSNWLICFAGAWMATFGSHSVPWYGCCL